MIEHPLLALQECIVSCGGKERHTIEEPGDLIGLPIYCKDMIVIGNRFAQVKDLAIALATRVSGSVKSPKDLIRQTSNNFHDIDLAGLRPVDLIDVGAKHPEGGP